MSFMNVDIKTNSKPIEIEKFATQEPSFLNGNKVSTNDTNYIEFKISGEFTFNNDTLCDVLIVGGGGGGGRNDGWEGGGGGGAGEVIIGKMIFKGNTKYIITIGQGGLGGAGPQNNGFNGGNTTLIGDKININAVGGGGGGWQIGLNGGSGGGGSGHGGSFYGGGSTNRPTSGEIVYYRNNGAIGYNAWGGGGGGGAGKNGYIPIINQFNGGNGGDGIIFHVNSRIYGGGGGGATGKWGGGTDPNRIVGKGGIGGGGNGGGRNNPLPGEANTGGGGGGSSFAPGGNGGSGIVIICYNNLNMSKLFLRNKPWGAYFAIDWDGNNTLLDCSENQRHATTYGDITKLTSSGSGAQGAITYISGGPGSKIIWPEGSIPNKYTILSLTKYNGNNRSRILTSYGGNTNWLHGHWAGQRGICYYEGWKTHHLTTIGNTDDWLCCIGNNGSSVPNNILVDGIVNGNNPGGAGNYNLSINNSGCCGGERSDWALSCVIIWDKHLDFNDMISLNNLISTYKITGQDISTLVNQNQNNEYDNMNDEKVEITKNYQFILNNAKYEYISIYDSSIDKLHQSVADAIQSTINWDNIVDKVYPLRFESNKYDNKGNYKDKKKRDVIAFKSKRNFVLKRISIFAGDVIDNAPRSWELGYVLNKQLIMLNDTFNVTQEDYKEFKCKSEDICINFLLDNKISSDIWVIYFNSTLGGSRLDFNKIILDEGIEQLKIKSTAGGNIEAQP